MLRLDVLRMSLLASLTACGAAGHESEADATDGPQECTSPPSCEDPVELGDGFEQCADGAINRASASSFPDASVAGSSCSGTEDDDVGCKADSECYGPNGRCVHAIAFDDEGNTFTYCTCKYACTSDSDCGPGEACIAPDVVSGTESWPTCQPAGCRTNADCGPCGECGVGSRFDGCSWHVALECRSASDQCRATNECDCYPDDDTGIFSCLDEDCYPGRPLLVEQRPRTAATEQRSDWLFGGGFADLRADPELALHWLEIAALEHASVASFARFGLQLMALGAPPELLRATHMAARDEIEHAKLAYALASAHGHRTVGPGRLDLRGVRMSSGWREVVRGLIEEGCVGETLGVVEAMAAAKRTTTPTARAVLDRIAADELRHAQLAWRSLAWLLGGAEPHNRAWALAQLGQAIERLLTDANASERVELHRQAAAEVLAPLAHTLAA